MNSDKLKWKYNGCVWMADASSHKDQYVIRRLVNAMIDTEAITFEVGHQTTERRRTREQPVSEWPTLKEAKASAQAHNDYPLNTTNTSPGLDRDAAPTRGETA